MQVSKIGSAYNQSPTNISFCKNPQTYYRHASDLQPFYVPHKMNFFEKILSVFKKKSPVSDKTMFLLRKVSNKWETIGDVSLNNLSIKDIDTICKILKDYPEVMKGLFTKQDSIGKNPAHYASAYTLKFMHEILHDSPETIAQMHLTKNTKGKIPAHKEDLAFIQEIDNELKSNFDLLRKIHLTENKKGQLPINYQNIEGIKEIADLFKDEPETIIKLFKTSSHFDTDLYPEIRNILTDISKKYDGDINKALKEVAERYR